MSLLEDFVKHFWIFFIKNVNTIDMNDTVSTFDTVETVDTWTRLIVREYFVETCLRKEKLRKAIFLSIYSRYEIIPRQWIW